MLKITAWFIIASPIINILITNYLKITFEHFLIGYTLGWLNCVITQLMIGE